MTWRRQADQLHDDSPVITAVLVGKLQLETELDLIVRVYGEIQSLGGPTAPSTKTNRQWETCREGEQGFL